MNTALKGKFLHQAKAPAAQRQQQHRSARATIQAEKLPLSSYRFPRLPQDSLAPLEFAVRQAVTHLEQAPFLQLHNVEATSRHSIDDSVVHDPQLWKSIARYLAEKDVERVLLVHPLSAPASSKSVGTVQTPASDVMTGITANAAHQSRLQSFADLVRSGATTADFSGTVGECCDDEPPHQSQVVAFARRHEHNHQQGSDSRPGRAHIHSEHNEQHSRQSLHDSARYWGVVLQSKDGLQDAGCYVLKTTHSAVADCTCIHWSLTRVCNGASIYDQLNSAWLVPE